MESDTLPGTRWPAIIQGGMGAGVSSWRLAKAVSSLGQLGVVSGVALEVILARRLQDGDLDGSIRRALGHFPSKPIADRILDKYFVEGGKRADKPYAPVAVHTISDCKSLLEICVASAFVEVYLAREGHTNPVGINYLEKIQLPHLPMIYGAMLAGVGFVIVGAGIPTKIPGILDRFVNHEQASYEITVTEETRGEPLILSFDPRDLIREELPPLKRPYFLPIVSSNTLAATMLKRSNGRVDGLIVEGQVAGGHNAPPRGKLELSTLGEPVYGERDAVDLEKIRALDLPFWLAGGQATAEKLLEARARGAAGIQIGTAFALCQESGLEERYRRALLEASARGTATVFTDPVASPTKFPFKIAQLPGSLSETDVYEQRARICDLGFLREVYRTPDGRFGYRCPSEPEDKWIAKGGDPAETVGRKCLCNALVSNIGHAQVRAGGTLEPPLITSGDDLATIARFLPPGESTYSARHVIDSILG